MERIELFSRFILESNLIEGIRDSEVRLRKMLGANWFEGHVGAILYLERMAELKYPLLDETDIRIAQKFILEEQGMRNPELPWKPEWAGKYRKLNVRVGNRICPHYSGVPRLMEGLVLQIQEWQKQWKKFSEVENLKLIADFHYEFEMIHPFVDGNGRTGRAIVFCLMRYIDKEPFVFTNNDKYLYYLPFQLEDRELMRRYFLQKTGNLSDQII